jgi:hypothetical protein
VTVSAFDPTPVGTSYSLKEKTIRIEPGDMVEARRLKWRLRDSGGANAPRNDLPERAA